LQENKELTVEGSKIYGLQRWQNLKNKDGIDNKPNQTQKNPPIQLATILKLKMSTKPTHPTCNNPKNEEEVNMDNTELAIHALDQVHCWDAYFHLRISHFENFTPLNF
jgi:hypothetical protein